MSGPAPTPRRAILVLHAPDGRAAAAGRGGAARQAQRVHAGPHHPSRRRPAAHGPVRGQSPDPATVRVFEQTGRGAEHQALRTHSRDTAGRHRAQRAADAGRDPQAQPAARGLVPHAARAAGVVPRDHVVEGPVRLALLADRPQGATPAFALRTPRASRSNWCPMTAAVSSGNRSRAGFRRWRRRWMRGQPASQKGTEALPTQRMSILPAQATHHYPRDEAVIEEARGTLRRSLHEDATLWETDAFSGARKLSKPKLYDLLIAGGITGVQGIAVPSADGKLYLPGGKGRVRSHGRPCTARQAAVRQAEPDARAGRARRHIQARRCHRALPGNGVRVPVQLHRLGRKPLHRGRHRRRRTDAARQGRDHRGARRALAAGQRRAMGLVDRRHEGPFELDAAPRARPAAGPHGHGGQPACQGYLHAGCADRRADR